MVILNGLDFCSQKLYNIRYFMIKIKVDRGSVERALQRLKKKLDSEGVLKGYRKRQFYEKPSEKKYQKRKQAIHRAKMQAKEDKLWS